MPSCRVGDHFVAVIGSGAWNGMIGGGSYGLVWQEGSTRDLLKKQALLDAIPWRIEGVIQISGQPQNNPNTMQFH
jgi:hypothetical protein